MNDNALKDVLAAIYRRRGKETESTKLFDNWPLSVQDDILQRVDIRADELPVLAFVSGPDRWLLITTQRIFDRCEDTFRQIECSTLSNVELSLATDAAHGAVDASGIKHLRLVLTGGKQIIIAVEPGQARNGIWNLLLHFVTLRARDSTADSLVF